MVLSSFLDRRRRAAFAIRFSTTAAIALFSIINVPASSAQQAPSPAVSAAQNDANRIQAISQQIAQTTQDPGIPLDIKTQMVNGLAGQFNQLVMTWQQDVLAATSAPGAVNPPAPATLTDLPAGAILPPPPPNATPGPVISGPPSNNMPGGLVATPTPSSSGVVAPTPSPPQMAAAPQSPDQLRSQAISIAQQMNTISQDPTLTSDNKTAQLNALAAQFNQLMTQLQQTGA